MSDALRLLTPREAAAALSISVRTIYRLARSGEIRSVSIGANLRFSTSALESFVQSHERGVGGPAPEPLRRGGRSVTVSLPRRRKEGASEQ